MLKECDVFSDSYGCIVTKSIGYQAPFPIVRLSNGHPSLHEDGALLRGACFASSLADPHATRGRLLSFDLSTRDSCVSFLQLMDGTQKPLELDAKTEFVKKIQRSSSGTVAVTRSEGGQWGTSMYVDTADTGSSACCSRVLFHGCSCAALRDDGLWLIKVARNNGDMRLLHRLSVTDALAGALADALSIEATLQQPLDVVALTTDTAVVFGTGGVAVADRRMAHVCAVAAGPIANGSVARSDTVVTFGEDCVLRVFDLRRPSVPLMASSSSLYLCVKAIVGCPVALLVTKDVAGVLDLQTMAVSASLQHSGDTVLDATLLPPHRDDGARICTTTASGMIYDWTVAT